MGGEADPSVRAGGSTDTSEETSMSLAVQCQCGNSYELKDEYAGRLVRCPKCQAVSRAERSGYTANSQADPVFDRDIFLLRQKHLAINEKYTVSDESGTPIVYVERPAHLLRNLLALLVGAAAAIAVFSLFVSGAVALGKGVLPAALLIAGGPVAFITLVV